MCKECSEKLDKISNIDYIINKYYTFLNTSVIQYTVRNKRPALPSRPSTRLVDANNEKETSLWHPTKPDNFLQACFCAFHVGW